MNRIPQSRDNASGHAHERFIADSHVYVVVIAVAASAICAALLARWVSTRQCPWIVLALAVADCGRRTRAASGSRDTTRALDLAVLMLFAAVLFGPLAGGLVGAASDLGDPRTTCALDPGSVAAPEARLSYTSSPVLHRRRSRPGRAWQSLGLAQTAWCGVISVATLVGSFVSEIARHVFATVTRGSGAADIVRLARTLAPLLAHRPCLSTRRPWRVLTLAYTEISPWTAPLFFIPALAAQRLFGMYLSSRRCQLALTTSSARTYRSRRLWWQLLRRAICTQQVTQGRRHLLRAISPSEWGSRRRAGTRIPLRARSRHRQGRAPGEPASEGWPADA